MGRSGSQPVSLSTSLWSYTDPQILVISLCLGCILQYLGIREGVIFLILCERQVLDRQKKLSKAIPSLTLSTVSEVPRSGSCVKGSTRLVK